MMRNAIIIILLLVPFFTEAQSKKKVSYAKGTVFGFWGYNRTGYTKSNMRFVGAGYDFTMQGAKAHDNPEKFSFGSYFNVKNITIPQFNARVGYYFKDHWALSIGYDHMKYIFKDGNKVKLSGTINPGIDTVTNLSGTYSGADITTSTETFHYENSDGLNYLRVELTRTDQWLKFGQKDWFAVSTNLGLSAGGLLTFNDFTFAGQKDVRTISMSGYGLSLHTGLRLEFFRHVFLQSGLNGGLHHVLKAKNRPNDPTAYTRHAYGYFEFNTVLGFFFYLRGKNACDSCPTW